jgi:hypothetical protein
MSEKMKFTVTIPTQELTDMALQIDGIELFGTVDAETLASYLKLAVLAGLEEYLGESSESVSVDAIG